MANPISFILGYKILTFTHSDAPDVLNLCMRHGLVYKNREVGDESLSIECSLYTAKRLEDLCESHGITILSISKHGLPHLLTKYRKRYGLIVGALAFVAIIFFSGRFIWDVRIDGAIRLSEHQVMQELSACGLKVGNKISDFKADVIENRVLIYSDDISWISINLSGTVAHVEIRESEPLPEESPDYKASNLIATADGQIESFEEVRGNVSVKIGDFVREGDLLVSGIYDSPLLGFQYVEAKGRVYARVENKYRIEIPLVYDKKVYTGKFFTEKYLIFFDKEIKIYSNSGNLPATCDTIDTVEYVNFLSGGDLPFGIRTVRHMEYRYEKTERDAEGAVELALYKLRCLEEEGGTSDIISKQISGEFSDGLYILDCTTVSVKNIARQVEIEIADTPTKNKES